MATVKWINENHKESKTHIEGLGTTLCGLEIPTRKEWSVYGIADCQRCIKAQKRRDKKN